MTFAYTPQILLKLEQALSAQRLGPYYAARPGDSAAAIKLYARDIAICEAFFGPLHVLEVVLRNSIDRELTAGFSANWIEDPFFPYEYDERVRIRRAKDQLAANHKGQTKGDLISELSFGFWVGLFKRKYENPIWRNHLRKVFPGAARSFLRREAFAAIDEARRGQSIIAAW